MNTYPKFVFTRSHEKRPLEWANAEQVLAHTDDDLVAFTDTLTRQPGRDIYLAGGASLARTFIRLGLVDEYRFFVYPSVSTGASWFGEIEQLELELVLVSSTPFENGVVGMNYLTAAR